MHFLKTIAPTLLLVVSLCLASTLPADDTSHREAVAELFELTGMQQQIKESIDNVLALQLAQNPELVKHKTEVREFLERHIGWQSLKDALTDMYLKEFTEKEINDMNAFYSSTTGRKVIERLPKLVSLRNQLASARLQENIGELEYAIRGGRQ